MIFHNATDSAKYRRDYLHKAHQYLILSVQAIRAHQHVHISFFGRAHGGTPPPSGPSRGFPDHPAKQTVV
ncbi:MAG: hypothetical protein ACQEQV_09245, partial [Fibrobacterota bacterium]